MSYTVEILSRYAPERSCNQLLYTPVESTMCYRETRRYEFEFSGSENDLAEFIEEVLVDRVSEEIHTGSEPALKSYRFFIDVGLKPGLLDLEKEYILKYYRNLPDPGFEWSDLKITRRIYLLGKDEEIPADRFVKDVVNPVIHKWHVEYGSGCA